MDWGAALWTLGVVFVGLCLRYVQVLRSHGPFATASWPNLARSLCGITLKFTCHVDAAAQFAALASHIRSSFATSQELGSQFVLYQGERKVVDAWGKLDGCHELDGYDAHTLQNMFSSTKVVESLCVAMLADRGHLDYEDTIGSLWPEFNANGKADITVADLMRHEAGLGMLADPLAPDDPTKDFKIDEETAGDLDRLSKLLASATPNWPPGESKRAYHALTRGWLTGEIVRRVDPLGRTLGQFVRDEIAGPLGVSLIIGVSAQEEQAHHFAPVAHRPLANMLFHLVIPYLVLKVPLVKLVPPLSVEVVGAAFDKTSWFTRTNPVTWYTKGIGIYNSPRGRKIEMPSANGQANARSMAKLAACLANGGELNGVRLLSP